MISTTRRIVVALCFFSATPALAVAQGRASAPKRIPAGTYVLVPDSTYSGGPDLSAFTVTFQGDTLMILEQGGAMMAKTKIAYDQATMTWTDFEGEMMCAGTARYTHLVSDTEVRLVPIEDSCTGRISIVMQIKLVKKR